jgi:hypothetical protein
MANPPMLASSDLIELAGGAVAVIAVDPVPGCIAGIPAPALVADGLPQLGNREFALTIVADQPSSLAVLALGWPAFPMFPLGNGCYLRLLATAAYFMAPNPAGVACCDLPISSTAALAWAQFSLQGATLTSLGITTTRTLNVTVGN